MYFILEDIFSLLINNAIGSKTILRTNVTCYINNIFSFSRLHLLFLEVFSIRHNFDIMLEYK